MSEHPHRPANFRPDVEGLRAVAILTVMWFHATLPGLEGGFAGVDIFFVISGFLITGQLVRELEATGRVSLPRFYARRAKRLLPAAVLTLVAAAILTRLFLPELDQPAFGRDIAAAAAYVVNWVLAARSVDYLAEDVGASPVQHFWSLAVEEQFYVVWPLLVIALAFGIRRGHLRVRPGLAVGLALITLPSLAWSIHLTEALPQRAYFVTTTRLWELGIGALVAVGSVVWTRLTPRAGAALGWGGLAVIVAGLLLQTTSTPWPGSAALVPTLGAALVIVGGFAAGSRGPVLLLGHRLPVAIGALSYSLYLWHWPLAVVAEEVGGGSRGWVALAVAASVIPAWLTNRLVENPIRFNRRISASPRLALGIGLACSLVALGAGSLVTGAASTGPIPTRDAAEAVGGATTTTAGTDPYAQPEWLTPLPARATRDIPDSDTDGCTSKLTADTFRACDYGETESDVVVALIGDSKAAQWLPAFDTIGREHGWRIRLYAKSGCPWSSAVVGLDDRPNTRCHDWGRRVLRAVEEEPPSVIVTSSLAQTAYSGAGGTRSDLVAGYVEYWSRLDALGVPVVALDDNPSPPEPIYACVSENPDDYMRVCTFAFRSAPGTAALQDASARVPRARFVSMNDLVCPDELCLPAIGNVLVYRQGSHLTATFVTSLTAQLTVRLKEAVPALR